MIRTPAIDVVATYSAAFRRDVFLAAGGFDPTFHEANNEDVEFSYRLSESGHRMNFVPEAQVYHRHANSWSGYARTKLGRGFWRTLVYRRYPGKALKDTYTPQILKLEILLAPLVPFGVLLAFLRRSAAWLTLAGPFLLITLSFIRFAAKRDRAVAVVSPWGLWLRSVAFAIGIAGGLLAGYAWPTGAISARSQRMIVSMRQYLGLTLLVLAIIAAAVTLSACRAPAILQRQKAVLPGWTVTVTDSVTATPTQRIETQATADPLIPTVVPSVQVTMPLTAIGSAYKHRPLARFV